MNRDDVLKVLEAAQDLCLVTFEKDGLLIQALLNDEFRQTFKPEFRDDVRLAVAHLITMRLRDTQDRTAHRIVTIEKRKALSGNITWYCETVEMVGIYFRQVHQKMLEDALLWDMLNDMPTGETWAAQIDVETVPDGKFLAVVDIKPGGKVWNPLNDLSQRTDAQDEVIRWARGLMAQKNFVVLDTETTDLHGYPVQIAVVDPDGEVLFNRMIKPPVPISREASRVHGITDADVADCPTFDEVFDELQAAVKDKLLVAYNVGYDWPVLVRAMAHHMTEKLANDGTACVMEQYAQYNGDWSDYHGNYKWVKLVEACRAEGVPVLDAHDALGDVEMTLGLIKALAGGK